MSDDWLPLGDAQGNPTGEYVHRPPEGTFLFLDGGTLDLMIWRVVVGWPTVRWVLARPWRWHKIPSYVRSWGKPLHGDNDFSVFREAFESLAVHPIIAAPRSDLS